MKFAVESVYIAVFLTLGTYFFGVWLRSKLNSPLVNPLLISAAILIAVLVGAHVDYAVYEKGAAPVHNLLGPATVSLAVPLYQQLEALKKNYLAILLGIVSGALSSAVCVLALSVLFGLTHEQYVTLLPKSITTAIGMGVSEELGGIVPITVAVISITGNLGNMFAEVLCRWFHITDPVARGIGIGSCSHAMGTARAMEMGEVEGAMSSLSIAVSGMITVVIASVFATFY